MKKFVFILIVLSIGVLFYSCGKENLKQKGSPEYISEIQQWHSQRITRLKSETGWLNLAGLFWLKEGENKFGSAKDNDIIFPSGPEHIGSLFLNDSIVTIKVLSGFNVLHNDSAITEMKLNDDFSNETTFLQTGSLKWNIIKRVKGYGIRLRDLNSELAKNFTTIETFPINTDWKINARFEPYNPPKKIMIPDVIGTTEEQDSPGAVVFTHGNQTHRMDALDAGGSRIWFIFADQTSGEETYGAGRFLYADKADSNGIVILDFNKAYNPPCVFSKYATCPLPPKDNFLRLRITAGEKMWGEQH